MKRLLLVPLLFLAAAVALRQPGELTAATVPTALNKNLVQNAGAELGTPPVSQNDFTPVPKWKTTNRFTQLDYGRSGFPTKQEAARIKGGKQFFTAGYIGTRGTASQLIPLEGRDGAIDAGEIGVHLSVQIATYSDEQRDKGHAELVFLNKGGKQISKLKTPVALLTQSKFVLKEVEGTLPKGTRAIRVVLVGRNTVAGQYIDAYFDNVDVRISG